MITQYIQPIFSKNELKAYATDLECFVNVYDCHLMYGFGLIHTNRKSLESATRINREHLLYRIRVKRKPEPHA